MADELEGVTKELLKKVFPVDRDPRMHPLMGDVLDTKTQTYHVVGAIMGTKGKPVLVVFDVVDQGRYAQTGQVWLRHVKEAKVLQRAEETIPASWRELLGR